MNLQINWIRLDQCLYSHYFLCHYLPNTAGKDTTSRRILRFKRGYQPELDDWVALAVRAIAAASLPRNLTVIRALHHDETIVPSHSRLPLDVVGEALAASLDGSYQPQLLKKSIPCRELKELPLPEREAELRDIYSLVRPAPRTPILILDDVLTSGTTMKGIIRALHAAHPPDTSPPPILLFTLAKAAG
jgi:hypothetical protein